MQTLYSPCDPARLYHLARLRVSTLRRQGKLIQGIEIGLGRSNNDIRVGAVAIDNAPGLFQTHRYFTLGVGAAGDVVNREQLQLAAACHYLFNRLERRIDRAAAL